MKPMLFSLLIVAAVSAQTPPAQTPPAQTPAPQRPATTTPTGNAEEGKKLYLSYGCYQCHG